MNAAPIFESALHESLGMSDKDLREELMANGLNPDSESEALRAMISLGIERAANRGEPERRLSDLMRRVS